MRPLIRTGTLKFKVIYSLVIILLSTTSIWYFKGVYFYPFLEEDKTNELETSLVCTSSDDESLSMIFTKENVQDLNKTLDDYLLKGGSTDVKCKMVIVLKRYPSHGTTNN